MIFSKSSYMQYKFDNSCYDIIIILFLMVFIYFFILKLVKRNEYFGESLDFEDYIKAAVDNKFTDEKWNSIKKFRLMHPHVYSILEMLDKKPKSYTLTIDQYYETKEKFITDILKVYSSN